MYLQRIIKLLLLLLVFSATNFSSKAATDDESQIKSPYRSEYNPYFEFGTFKRGFKNETLKLNLDSLDQKPRKLWNRADSLEFADLSLKTGNTELAEYYFEHLKIDFDKENDTWWNRLVLHYVNRQYNSCIGMIRTEEPGLVEFSKLWFFNKICLAKLRALKDEKWYKTESVFSWQIDSSLLAIDKESDEFQEKIIVPLENLNFVLEKLVRFVYDDDEIIARACYEMGIILKTYVSPTQAYIAMCLGRNYDKWDKDILAGVKEVKAMLVEKKYRIPIFRSYFPRIEYWRFDYDMLKEKIIYARNDTILKTAPALNKEIEKKGFEFNSAIIVFTGIALIFLIVLIVLKVK